MIVPVDDIEVDYVADDQLVVLGIRNVGRGAAYDIDAALKHADGYVPANPWSPGETDPANFTVLPVGDSLDLHFTNIESRPTDGELVIDYEDLTGRPYATRVQVRELRIYEGSQTFDVLRMARAKLFDDHQLVPWNDPKNYTRRRLRRLWRRANSPGTRSVPPS